MRLFHVSEESDIERFEPRRPTRQDLDQETDLVWAINEQRLVNFFTPRNCPRVTFYAREDSRPEDIKKFMGCNGISSVIAIEYGWFHKMMKTTLMIYEFDPTAFFLQDEIAGYYVSTKPQVPISVSMVDDLFAAIFERNAELRVLLNLWALCDSVQASTLGYSMCRMGNALPRKPL